VKETVQAQDTLISKLTKNSALEPEKFLFLAQADSTTTTTATTGTLGTVQVVVGIDIREKLGKVIFKGCYLNISLISPGTFSGDPQSKGGFRSYPMAGCIIMAACCLQSSSLGRVPYRSRRILNGQGNVGPETAINSSNSSMTNRSLKAHIY